MFQLPLTFEEEALFGAEEIIRSPYFALILFLVFVFWAILAGLLLLRAALRYKARISEAFRQTVLLVTVPKELPSAERHEETAAKIQEEISAAENIWSNIGGLRAEKGFLAWLRGRRDQLSLEIVTHKGLISFYFVVPRHLREFTLQQIHAQYPRAQIEEVVDYNIFSPRAAIVGSYLTFKRPSVFPIKTYKKLETDSQNALTNALAKVDEKDGAAVQIMIRSARPGWRSLGVRLAREMQQGKSLKQVMGEMSFWGKFWGLLRAAKLSPKSNEESKKEAYRLSPLEEEMVKGLEEKAVKAGLEVNLRIVASSETSSVNAQNYLNNILNSFGQYSIYQYGNSFQRTTVSPQKLIRDFIYRNFNEKRKIILNTEELASIFHLPLHTAEAPNIRWLLARLAPPPLNIPEQGLILGRNTYRSIETIIRMTKEDRRRHLYVIGQTGTGKSTFFQELIKQDIRAGEGVCVLDPHGDMVELVLECIPKNRAEDVIYFNPTDTERPMGLNLLEYDSRYPEQKTFVINEMINIFDKLYDLRATGGPMFEMYMRNAMLLVMEHPESGATLMEIPKVLADAEFRHFKLKHCRNTVVHDFWVKEAEKAGGEAALSNMTPYITSKLTPFIANDMLRPIIAQEKSSFNLRDIMDNQKLLLVNLSKGTLGDINAYLLGLVIVGKLSAAALSRGDIPENKRKDFYLYIDEFQNFITETIGTILSEARKYRLCLNITHQFIGQLVKDSDTKIRDAVFGNVGTQMTFRIGPDDAEFMEKQFAPRFSAEDLINIANFNAYLKPLIHGFPSKAFNIEIYKHWSPWSPEAERLLGVKPNPQMAENIKQLSRLKYGRDKALVEAEVAERTKLAESGTGVELPEERRGEEFLR